MAELDVVTGVFSYSGGFIARELLGRGQEVRTLDRRLQAAVALGMTAVANPLLGEVVVTREELGALAANLLLSTEPPCGRRSFAEWVGVNAPTLGSQYVSELERNVRPYAPI